MVVEGVEDAATLEALREWGCDIAQGYHIARPMPADRFLAWLEPPARHGRPPSRVPAGDDRQDRLTCHPSRPLISNGWPPARWRGLEEDALGDWLLRAGDGFTGRANSALVVGGPPGPLAGGRRRGDRLVRRRAACARAPRCRCPAARTADAALAAAGWTRDEDVLVLTAPLDGWPHADRAASTWHPSPTRRG